MTRRKTTPVAARFRLWLRTFVKSGTNRRKHIRVRYIHPNLEALEDRTLLSSSPASLLPVVSVGSPPPAPSLAAVTSFVAERMSQWSNFIATVQQDVIGLWKAIGQEIAQEVSFVEQQWERPLGIDPSAQNPSSNITGQQAHSGSGSGSSSGHDSPLSPEPVGALPTGEARPLGSGSGGGSGSGSGSASGSGSGGGGSPPTVYFSSSSYNVNESDGIAVVEVDLSAPSNGPVTVVVSTSDGTAFAGIDYLSESITVSFPTGATNELVPVRLIDDGPDDESETGQWFSVTLSNVTGNAVPGYPGGAAVNILEGSPPPPPPGPPTVSFSSASYSVTEGNKATVTLAETPVTLAA
jgi:hypothetical protein